MAQLKFGSAGVSAREIDLSGPITVEPAGIPAGIVGTSLKGPAFVPVTVGLDSDFYAKFGKTDGKKFGPLAAVEWLRNAQSVTYLRVLGVGQGTKRNSTGNNPGNITNAGFVVGEKEPDPSSGLIVRNPYANNGGVQGRTYFLGAFMSESNGSTIFSSAGLQGVGSATPGVSSSLPIIRGIIMAASGVIPRLSASHGGTNSAPASNYVAVNTTTVGSQLGAVALYQGTQPKQEFVLLLNGHIGTDPAYPNIYTCSFDITAPNYFTNILNKDPYKLNQAGHYVYANWDIHPALATITGSGLLSVFSGAFSGLTSATGKEQSAFLTTGSANYNTGLATVPNYENFEDRYRHAKSPWIISQKFGGSPINLFRFHMLDDGANTATNIKISIENLSPSNDSNDPYGSFDVVVRDWADNDLNVRPLEQFRGMTINPSSDRYIGKIIGDLNVYYDFDKSEPAQKVVVAGNYPNRSNYIRVEVSTQVDDATIDPSALPCGFHGPAHLVTSGTSPMAAAAALTDLFNTSNTFKNIVQQPVPYRAAIFDGTDTKIQVNPSYYWGVQFEHVTNVASPNSSLLRNASLESFTKYFPDYMTSYQNFIADDSTVGTADSAALGILDSDRFCNNLFTIENIQVVTASTTYADPQSWANAVYVRKGNITANDTNKTRGLTVNDLTVANKRYVKFTTYLQGGFDGTNIFDRNEAEINDAAVKADMDDVNRGQALGASVVAYLKAVAVMKNKTDVDVQLLAIPGIRQTIVTDTAIAATEDRFDALYIMDIQEYDTLNSEVTSSAQIPSVINTATNFAARALNSSFAASYYPNVIMTDPNTNTNVVAPPSVAVLGAFSLNDRLSHPWFAPAGFVRGALTTVLEANVRLSKDNMDTLYDANINPLVAFPGSSPAGTQAQGGVVVWGQRTLQSFASALDRVNVRRLLIDLRRQVRDIANTIVFEPAREITLAKFQSAVEPRLAKIQAQFGVTRYLVKIDTETTTQADIENNTLRGKIWIQPTRSVEYVSLDFEIKNAGATL
jgi:phage tail sheath protein FI